MQVKNVVTTDYRSMLMSELLRRIEGNPAYSLRRFAHQLGVSPATLCGVLSGKRRLSLKSALQVSSHLGLSPSETAKFYQAVASGLMKNGTQFLTSPKDEYFNLSEDVFRTMSEWYYYAILELTFVKSSRPDPRWFATKLGINHNQAVDAIARLTHLGLLESKNGRLVKTKVSIASSTGVPSAAIRNRHKQILKKATESLEEHTVEERDFTSMTMAIDPALLPEARKKITEFRRDLCRFLESGKKKRVYEMSVQLFPLSEGEENEKN